MLGGVCILGIAGVLLIGRLCSFLGETADMYSFLEKTEEQDSEVKKAVTFENASIEAGVRKALHKSENALISQAELEQVTALILCGDKVFTSWEEHMSYHNDYWYEVEEQAAVSEPCNNLADLKSLKNLRVLVLDNQGIEELPDLSGLPLQKVSLCSNQLTDISGLSKNTGIQVLWLKKNPLSDLTGISALTQLTEIDISDTQVSDVKPLKNAPLRNLYCEYTNVDNQEVIAEFTDLSALRMSHADENVIKMVSEYTNLHMLGLYDSQVTTLKSFRNLKKLESLDLSGCENLMHLEGVEQLANLNYLGIPDTGVNALPEDFMMEKLEIIDLHNLVIDDYTPLLHCPKLKLIYTGIEAQKRAEYQLLGENIRIQSF